MITLQISFRNKTGCPQHLEFLSINPFILYFVINDVEITKINNK